MAKKEKTEIRLQDYHPETAGTSGGMRILTKAQILGFDAHTPTLKRGEKSIAVRKAQKVSE